MKSEFTIAICTMRMNLVKFLFFFVDSVGIFWEVIAILELNKSRFCKGQAYK